MNKAAKSYPSETLSLVAPKPACDPLQALPFVDGRRLWAVPDESDYLAAFHAGKEFADAYLQHLKDNPQHKGNGLLGQISQAIANRGANDNAGYRVGFYYQVEECLSAG